MRAVTRELPCSPVIAGKPTMFAFTGIDIGPLFVHRGQPDKDEGRLTRGDWTVTHVATGYSVQKLIQTKVGAIRMARQLVKLDCWGFTEPDQAQLIPGALLRLIADIREGRA